MFDQKSLYFYALQIGYLNLYNSVRATRRENYDHSKCSNCGGSHPSKKYLINKESKGDIRNSFHLSIRVTPKMNVLKVTI